ncbi:MAG: F0F1 ATP synthase subunit delta [Rhodoferax sp.]
MKIDWWTLGLQTINVVILVWLLSRFLFKPVAAIIAERQASAARLLSDAQAARDAAQRDREAASEDALRLAAAREQALREAGSAAEAEKARLLAQAQIEAAHLREQGQVDVASARAAEARVMEDRAANLAVDIAARLLARLPDSARVDGFVDGLAAAVAALPAGSRTALASGAPLRVSAARALTPVERDQLRAVIGESLGRAVTIEATVDPSLLAGLELNGDGVVVRNSLRADLAQVLEVLTHHDA